ncbi:MAG: AMP-binding protein [Legionella sp.]|uniref:phosphosulfolactate synthase n=1 Tax=Legionella sp. TaxID=459 RepID=UPI0028476A70|nr:AMP-binding protein [Legionella sp.]
MVLHHPRPENMVELLNLQTQTIEQDRLFFLNSSVGIEEKLNYASLRIRAQSIAARIQKHTQPGDRVLLIYQPGLDFICAFYACLYAGVIAVPVYPPAEKKLIEKLQAVIKNAEPKIILSTESIIKQITKLKYVKALQNLPFVTYLMERFQENAYELTQWDFDKFTWINTDTISDNEANDYKEPLIKPDNIAFLQYTSGSTGQPKGVMVSHSNLLNNLQFINEYYNAQHDSVCIVWLPPYHDMGLIGGILYPIFTGIPGYLMSPMTFLRNPATWLKAITDFKGTVTSAPNFAYALCNKKISEETKAQLDLSCMHAFLNGAEPINAYVMDEFTRQFAHCGFNKEMFMPCYGLAENTLMVTAEQGGLTHYFNKKELRNNKLIEVSATDPTAHSVVGCGTLSEGITLVDPETLIPCGDKQIGEVWLSSPSVAHGYWNQEQETNTYFKATLAHTTEKNYLRTGDLGFTMNNRLFIMGRLKDLIIINGTNHYPQDIERSVETCHPAIRQGSCAAVSVTGNYKEELAVVVEINKNCPETELEAIVSAVKEIILQDHSLSVHQIALISERSLPKTTSGKIRRRLIQSQLMDKQLEIKLLWVMETPLPEEIKTTPNKEVPANQQNESSSSSEFIQNLRHTIHVELSDMLDIDSKIIDDNKNFAEFGLDSLMAVELEARLQSHLKTHCQLSEATVVNYPTINLLIEHIQTLLGKSAPIEKSLATPFAFITIPEHTLKPRTEGLTSLLDTGMHLMDTEHLLLIAADYIDVVKLGFGTSKLYPEAILRQKIDLLKSANIHVCAGGTFFEVARRQNKIEEYFKECVRLGFNCLELSDGLAGIPLEEKINLISRAKSYGFVVLSEVGRKDAQQDSLLSIEDRLLEIKEQLNAGAWKIILEARESGTTGLFNTDTSIKTEDFARIITEINPGDLLFEAPIKHQQAWLINQLGVSVNLANIAPKDVLALEALRISLRADTIHDQ